MLSVRTEAYSIYISYYDISSSRKTRWILISFCVCTNNCSPLRLIVQSTVIIIFLKKSLWCFFRCSRNELRSWAGSFASHDCRDGKSRADSFDEIEVDLNLGFVLHRRRCRRRFSNSCAHQQFELNKSDMYIIIWLEGILRCSTNINLIDLGSL